MKSTEEHRALQLLDKAGDYATRGETLTIIGDEPVALIRAVVGVGLGLIAVCEEIRETRHWLSKNRIDPEMTTPPVIVGCACAARAEKAQDCGNSAPGRNVQVV